MDYKDNVAFALRELSIAMARYFGHMNKDCPHDHPSGIQIGILDYLEKNKNKDIFQKDLEKEFMMRRPTASRVLARMETSDYIQRVSVPYDGRLKKIIINPEVFKKRDHPNKRMEQFNRELTNGLSEKEIEQFIQITTTMKNNIKR